MTAIAAVTALFGTGTALAYGSADKPIAQVEISANCDNPGFALCQEVGVGGVWAWAELNTSVTYSSYYVLDFAGQFAAAVPGAYGHYTSPSSFPAGAQFQTQVAP